MALAPNSPTLLTRRPKTVRYVFIPSHHNISAPSFLHSLSHPFHSQGIRSLQDIRYIRSGALISRPLADRFSRLAVTARETSDTSESLKVGQRDWKMGFGDFTSICEQVMVPLCSLVGSGSEPGDGVGIEADCYARNIELANTIIFQGAASFMHIIALIMTAIMILHVRSKFTAVGRKEISIFFYIYMLLSFVSLILDSGVIPPGNNAYLYFVAIQAALTSALCACLLVNGFVGFQLYEDGTRLSVWLLRSVTFAMFAITFLVSLATFKSWAGLSPTNTAGLFIVLYLINAIELFIYVAMQIILVVNTLQDRWPLGDIAFGCFFFIIGQVILYAFSRTICNAVQHYLDGLFFATICNLLAVMMVYKYWDSITREDLEFSVGTKQNNWEVKELLPEEDPRNTIYQDNSDYAYSQQHHGRNSNYGGFAGY